MKHLLLTTIAAVLVVGCGESQSPEPPTAKAPDISIHIATRSSNIEAVKQHLAAGTDVDARDEGGVPLRYAAETGHKEIAELLIANGADVNAKGELGETPLHDAAQAGQKEIIELLIAKGADVNAKGGVGQTPLHYAAGEGRKEIAELLIAKGADVNAKVVSGAKQGLTPLDAANETNHSETADLLRKHGGKTGEELKAEGK
ncbi:ankyrin repeat domain-containing protein [bacterium]|nr:ankyrin repeat domain-containing protein [bacterium]